MILASTLKVCERRHQGSDLISLLLVGNSELTLRTILAYSRARFIFTGEPFFVRSSRKHVLFFGLTTSYEY